MKRKVKRRFRDVETAKFYNAGDTFEGKEHRMEELADKGFLEKKKSPKKKDE